MFEKLPETMEIDMADLPHIDILPPRRTFVDFVPVRLKSWVREKYKRLTYTKFEMWVVYSWMLRSMANKLLIAANHHKKEKQAFVHSVGKDYKPGKGGWN